MMVVITAGLAGLWLVGLAEAIRRYRPGLIFLSVVALGSLGSGLRGGAVTDQRPVVGPAWPTATPTPLNSPAGYVALPRPGQIVTTHTPPPPTPPLATLFPAPHLHLPRLELSWPIQTIPITAGVWDVSQLEEQVGHLAGTGRTPADEHPIVLVGHMTFPLLNQLEQGAFAQLDQLLLGDVLTYQFEGVIYTYEVTQVGRVAPAAVSRLLEGDGTTLLLVTCTDWNFFTYSYDNRLVVQAVFRE